MYFSRMKSARTTLLAASSRSVKGTCRRGRAGLGLARPALTCSLRPTSERSDCPVPSARTGPLLDPHPLLLPGREAPSRAPPPAPPGLGSPPGPAALRTHPALLLPGDADPLELPLQHIALPQAPVALPLTLLLVQPAGGGTGETLEPAAGRPQPRIPRVPAPLCPPHWRSKSLSVFRKSCLARSRMSGSSLEVRGER